MFVDRFAQALWFVGCVGMVMAGCSRGTRSSTANRPTANGSNSIVTHTDDAPATSDTAATKTKKTLGSGSSSLNPAALRSIKKRMATQETDGTTLSLAGITLRVPFRARALWPPRLFLESPTTKVNPDRYESRIFRECGARMNRMFSDGSPRRESRTVPRCRKPMPKSLRRSLIKCT